MKLLILILFFTPAFLFSQDGRIDTLITVDENSAYILKNNIDSSGNWTVDIVKRVKIFQKELEVNDTIVQINHERYNDFYLEINGDKSYQFLVDEEKGEKYYIYSDVHANPKNGISDYTKCLYKNVVYPQKAQEDGIEGMAVMRLYINKKGCLDKVEPQSQIGYGIEEVTKMAMESCNCSFNPSKRDGKSVNAIWIMPMKFKLN